MKTKKSILKRFKITKNNKLVRRPAGQNHFNSREEGEKKREKHGVKLLHKRDLKRIIRWVN